MAFHVSITGILACERSNSKPPHPLQHQIWNKLPVRSPFFGTGPLTHNTLMVTSERAIVGPSGETIPPSASTAAQVRLSVGFCDRYLIHQIH